MKDIITGMQSGKGGALEEFEEKFSFKDTCTSRINAICCGGIAAVLPIRSNISRKNERKNIK